MNSNRWEYEKKIQIGEKQHQFRIILGDITDESTDAIVNAANTQLILGGGVAGAINRKGGPEIQSECFKTGEIKTGEAIITTGGKLKAHYVIHAVGPIWFEHSISENEILLEKAIISSLQCLETNRLQSITFPAISTGIYGFPKKLAAEIMVKTIYYYFKIAHFELKVQICLFNSTDFSFFKQALTFFFSSDTF